MKYLFILFFALNLGTASNDAQPEAHAQPLTSAQPLAKIQQTDNTQATPHALPAHSAQPEAYTQHTDNTQPTTQEEQGPKIYFIYNASGTLGGELNYLYGKYFQDEHCELCDITHGTFSAKPEWKEWVQTLSCEYHVLHTNEAEAMKVDYSQFTLPVVLVDRGQGLEELVSKKEMHESGKGVDAFIQLFTRKQRELGISCP